jgi:hypothetical protein
VPPVLPPVEIPSPSERSHLRGSTWLSVQVHRLNRRACKTSRHRTECAAGADLPNLDTTVAGCARTQLVDPTTGPPASARSQNARSSNDCVRVVTSRVAHRSSRLTLEWPEDHRWTKRSDRGAAPPGPPLVRAARSSRHVPLLRNTETLASSRSESPVDVRFPPSCDPKTTLWRAASADRLSPSSHLVSGVLATDPAQASTNASSTRIVSSQITPPAFLSRPGAARRPPLGKRLVPSERHLRAAL